MFACICDNDLVPIMDNHFISYVHTVHDLILLASRNFTFLVIKQHCAHLVYGYVMMLAVSWLITNGFTK